MTETSQSVCADDVIITHELDRRPSRAVDHEAESQALSGLAETMANEPDDVLQRLVETAMLLTRSGSAGLSLMEPGEKDGVFRWVATAGAWAPYRNGSMPHKMSPCGEVIARDQVLLVRDPARAWPALLQADPAIGEALLAPFRVNGELKGTVWVIKHGADDRFDREDARILQSLSRFAAAAHQVLAAADNHREIERRQAFLLKLSDALRPLAGPAQIKAAAARLLGEQLKVNRAFYADADGTWWLVAKGYEHAIEPLPDAPFAMSDYGDWIIEDFRADRPLVVEDMAADPRFSAAERAANLALSIAAVVALPLVKNGELVAMLTVQNARPRPWSPAELALIGETAERTWAAVERARAEEALRDSEERFRGALEIETVGATFWKPGEYTLARSNDAFLRMIGRTREEAIGISSEELTAPEFREESKARVAEAERTGILAPYEKQVLRPDGSRVWLLCAGRMLKDELFEFILNVNERKLADEALRESEMRFREFGENSSDALWIVDGRTKQLEYLSPAFERIWGESREAVMADADRWAELVHPDDRDLAGQAMPRLLGGEPFIAEYRIVRSDGEVRWIRDTGFPIKVDGVVKRGGGIAQDVTDLRQSQAALRESEERLREFGEASQDVLWIRDAETLRWTYLTPAFETIYGFGREEALAGNNFRNWLDLIVPEDRHRAVACIRGVRDGERVTFEYRVRRPKDGAICWLRNTDFPIHGSNGKVAFIGGIGHDITREREMAGRQQVLVAELQHRTRNLMGVVRSMADRTIATSDDLPNLRTRFRERLDALARVQGLLSRLEEHDRVTFDELIRTELAAMDGELDRVTLAGPEGVRLRSSMVQTLAMAVHELATNAVKYGAFTQPGGHLAISWSLAPPDAQGRPWLNIDWRESGVIVPAKGAAPQGTGQGRELIEEALPYQLGAKTHFTFEEDGVHCTISLPVSGSSPAQEELHA